MAYSASRLRWGLTVAVVALVFAGLYLLSLHSYLLFHSIAELFIVVVGCAMFLLAWNARRAMANDFLLFLGTAYLFVAGIDLLHTLAYAGMNVFDRRGSNLPTQLWIAARYLQAGAIAIAPVFLKRRLRLAGAFAVLLVLSSLLILSIFRWPVFPTAYVEGQGLTRFKIISEYVICGVLAGALYMLFRSRGRLDPRVFRLLTLSVSLTIASELAFTEYVSVYGFFNLLGHYLKILAFYFVYRAIIVMGLTEPYEVLFRTLKQREERLAESEHRYRILVELSPDAVAVEAEGRLLYLNTAARKLFGADRPEELLEKPVLALADPISHDLLSRMMSSQSGRTLLTLPGEARLVRLDGQGVDAEVSATPIAYDGRQATLLVLRDITERKRAEQELRFSEARYRGIVEDQTELICRWRQDGTLTFVNEAYCRYFRKQREELIGRSFLPHIPAEDRPRLDEHFRSLGPANPVGTQEHRVVLPDGEIRWQHWTNRVILDQNGAVAEIQSVGRDVTEGRKVREALVAARDQLEQRVKERTADYAAALEALQMEVAERVSAVEALRESSRMLEAFFKHAFTPLVFLDKEFNFVRVNEAYARACQRDVSEFPGRNHFELYPSEAKEIFEEVVRSRTPFKTSARPFQFPDHPEWGVSYWDWELFPLLDEAGEVEFLVFVLEDVTQRTKSEARLKELNEALEDRARQLQLLAEELLQAEQRERRRIALVLHDHIQQLLVGAKLRVTLLTGDVETAELRDVAQQLGTLLQQAIDLTRTLSVELCPPTLYREGLAVALRWLGNWMEEKHGLSVTVDAEEGANPENQAINTLLFQSVRELLFNVAKHSRVSRATVAMERLDEEHLRITVQDEGTGFDATALRRVTAGAAGLGLFSIRERLRLIGGSMAVQSSPGQGCRITLEAPLQGTPPPWQAPPERASQQ